MGVTYLKQCETAGLNFDQLDALCTQLGPTGAEDVMRRAMEELALRLNHAERLFREGDLEALGRATKSLIAIADQIGMGKLARVAGDVTSAVEAGDSAATAATLARLLRVGERSLLDVWDLQDLTI